jgi:ribosome recycling factor
MSTIANIKQDTQTRMQKSVDSLHTALTKIRTGRAHPSLLDQVVVSYYGTDTPLNQVATVNASDSRTLLVTPWEKAVIPAVEKAILNSGLGLNPATSGNAIRVPLPPLSEERRKEMIKVVKGECEDAKIAVRNVRRDANTLLKEQLKKKLINEDDDHRAQDEIQKLTDKFVAEVDKILVGKEKELMEV